MAVGKAVNERCAICAIIIEVALMLAALLGMANVARAIWSQ